MKNYLQEIPCFDDIVFEGRNRKYGAYILRRKYRTTVLISMFTAIILLGTLVITPYLNAKAMKDKLTHEERHVEISMENLDQPNEKIVVPPPPAPPADVIEQQKYIPPVVVDTIKPEDNVQLMTADEAQDEVRNTEVIEFPSEVKEEVKEAEPAETPFLVVEENPMFPGGESELYKYISEHLNYPEVAQENNIQGKVIIKFCVTAKGGVSQISILKGVDPELDAEAIRVVKTLPAFKPGRQGGIPVPVWYIMPIKFQILN
jgi:periplasmic protein TonB